ncbi:hypothetical protein FRC05_000013 [Tulasnella sp. 425]|nr:hypothetical protein FRC05_000013 [Tulasnella sp. 425]
MTRGATAPAPIYQRRQHQQQQSTDGDDPAMRLAGIAGLSRIDELGSRSSSGAATTDTVRRTLGASEVTATTSSRPMLSPALVPSSSTSSATTTTANTTTTTTSSSAAPPQGLFTPPQTPSSPTSFPSGMTTPRIIDSERSASIAPPTYFPMTSYQPMLQEPPTPTQQPQQPPSSSPSPSPPAWTPMAPSVSAGSSSSITPSQLRRQSPQAEIKMEIETSPTSHTLLAPLGSKFTSDAITIAAKKNNVLQIMADRWDQEKDCK